MSFRDHLLFWDLTIGTSESRLANALVMANKIDADTMLGTGERRAVI